MNNDGKEILKVYLENQKAILNGLSKLLTPFCMGSIIDKNGETECNVELINRYHKTEKLLNKLR